MVTYEMGSKPFQISNFGTRSTWRPFLRDFCCLVITLSATGISANEYRIQMLDSMEVYNAYSCILLTSVQGVAKMNRSANALDLSRSDYFQPWIHL
ncbi:hypothetical protein BCR33DRAFT_713108 [Rhizoclosmatium globosum]|uniref:Uncharacterized protein n=1 Tax=Rhizoclosmatium globosum TaxID=329046 RepID=A0A1Y2CVB5_9FUNG|nr:hypothetical protein BCR33DRAFT_713108 [Rhizoclosmatium globosum]|eukprot:ORY50275.1 hypothetical protein BCR33DRAFT_713108 [Rhizoclosmatium globosum]